MSVADPVAGPAAPVAAEFLALAYDQSLDALAAHAWPGDLMGMFRRESSWLNISFTNRGEGFNHVLGHFDVPQVGVPQMTYRVLRDPFGTPASAEATAAGCSCGCGKGRNPVLCSKPLPWVPQRYPVPRAKPWTIETWPVPD
jgi:hypothetical protein